MANIPSFRDRSPDFSSFSAFVILGLVSWICLFPAENGLCADQAKDEVTGQQVQAQADTAAKDVSADNAGEKAQETKSAASEDRAEPKAATKDNSVQAAGPEPLTQGKSSETSGQAAAAGPQTAPPIIVNADSIEYSGVANEVVARGNVVVDYKGSKLSCDKMTINTVTKDAVAQGSSTKKARLEDKQGIKEGTKIIYNFDKKSGVIVDAEFKSNPYFGTAEKIDKVSEQLFVIKKGFISTCSYDRPHWRLGCDNIDYYPQNKINTKGDTFYIGEIPVMYIPEYSHSLRDPLMKIQLNPGHSKDWGYYMETIYRMQFNEHITGRLLLDYRQLMGPAEGYGINYQHENFGKGDIKYYYMEEDPANFYPKDAPNTEFQRYLLRWRHKWTIDQNTDFTAEMVKILDSKRQNAGPQYDILKDYFYREFEKDSQPLTYLLFHHNFSYSTFDFYAQKRLNHWYDQQDKMPEMRYTMANLQLGNTPMYLENSTYFTVFDKKESADTFTDSDINMTRFDATTRVSIPRKVFFIEFTPFVKSQETFYNKDNFGNPDLMRTIFYSGADMSTKFYRTFNINTDFLGLDLHQLRHIITPTIAYTFQNSPTISSDKLKQFDSIDTIGPGGSTATLGFYNKLQTKRNGQSIDLVDFRVDNTYNFETKNSGGNLSDFLFNLRILPYSWMTFQADATYKHSGPRDDPNYGHFSNVNYDLSINFGEERNIGLGQRYARGAGNELTCQFKWRINPKWKVSAYQRRQLAGDVPGLLKGLREQEYVLSRDFHCWEADFTWNIKRGQGESLWLVFRLKAFPELEFDYNQSYHQPKPGSQSEQNY